MEHLLLSFNVVAPLVIYMGVGILLRKTGLVSRDSFSQLSQLVFYVAIPALCIESLQTLDFDAVFSDPFTLYLGAGILLLFFLCMVFVPMFCKDNSRRGVLIHGIFRSNDGVFGIAVGTALLGEAHMGLMILAVAITIPVYNVLAILVMELYRGGKPNPKAILLQLVQNPILIACVVGFALGLSRVELPSMLSTPLTGLSKTCTPLGFISLGGTLTFASIKENRKAISLVALLRLIVIPILFVGALYLMGYRGDQLLVGTVIFAAPTAVSLYPMACSMNGDSKLAAGIIAVTSVLSILTMFLSIFILKQTGVA